MAGPAGQAGGEGHCPARRRVAQFDRQRRIGPRAKVAAKNLLDRDNHMLKFTAGLFACTAFATLSGGAVAGETRDITDDWEKGKDSAECATASACQHEVTYVSGKGRDSGGCHSPWRPCRTFQYAVDRTSVGGEIKTLDPANYFPVKITKSITITGVDGAGINSMDGKGIVAIPGPPTNSGPSVKISKLVIQNVSGTRGAGTTAIFGNFISIIDCTIRGFDNGISIGLNGRYLISNTIVTNNNVGINLGDVNGTVDHVIASDNSTGIALGAGSHKVVDTVITDNFGAGLRVFPGANVFLAHSTASGNGTGVEISLAYVTSFGDNHIKGNGKDVVASPPGAGLVNVGTQ